MPRRKDPATANKKQGVKKPKSVVNKLQELQQALHAEWQSSHATSSTSPQKEHEGR